jgi:hypothetical protein
VIQDPSDEVDKLAEKTESLTVAETGEPSFTGMKKKKKKHVSLVGYKLQMPVAMFVGLIFPSVLFYLLILQISGGA